MAGSGGVRIDAHEFTTLMRDAKAFDRNLGLRLQRNIREAAKPVVADVRAAVLQAPPDDRPGSVGTRAAIAKGVGLRISTAARGGSVTIAASSRALPAGRKPMLRAYNKKAGWRHPTFGNRDVWQHQQGRPYFGSVIAEHTLALKIAVQRSLFEAAEALGRRR
jgi:hypothetical protein